LFLVNHYLIFNTVTVVLIHAVWSPGRTATKQIWPQIPYW